MIRVERHTGPREELRPLFELAEDSRRELDAYEAAIALAAEEGRATLLVSTAAADTGNLRLYQRLGFRMRSIDRDAFTAATGDAGIVVDGIELRDRVWLDRPVA